MMQTKLPSQLWDEATPNARAALSELLGEIHVLWQASEHYSPLSVLERTPRAHLNWEWSKDGRNATFRWSGLGVDEALVVEIDQDHPARALLFSEPFIYLLKGWLMFSGTEGIPAGITPQEMDRFDVRDRLAPYQDKPNAIKWAVKDLYDLFLVVDAKLAQHGLESWGFWDEERKDAFIPWDPDGTAPAAFQDLSNVFKNDLYPGAFAKICQSGEYTYDVAGLIKYRENYGDEARDASDGCRLGRLEEFLLLQEPLSILNMIGQAHAGLRRVSRLSFEDEPFLVGREPYKDNLPLHYSSYEMTNDLINIGKKLAQIELRIREERRALFARRFDNASADRQRAANDARMADSRKRESLITRWMETTDLEPFRTKSTGHLKIAPMSRAFLETDPFAGKIKSSVGPKQAERLFKRLLKKDISPK